MVTGLIRIVRCFALLALFWASPAFAVTPMIAAGYGHTVALKADGTVAAWGDNGSGQLGDGSTQYRLSPVAIPGFTGVDSISAGHDFTLALKSDGTVWASGGESGLSST